MSSEHKNILVLCPDEMRWDALGIFGQSRPVTPHLDRWANKGAALDHCFVVHPKCTPSRCGFLSGQYPHSGGHRTLDMPLRPEESNYARHLKQHGYQTVLVGKNHVLTPEAMEGSFDHWFRPTGFRPLESAEVERHPPGSYLVGKAEGPTEEFTDVCRSSRALDWIENGRDTEKPFFLWLNWELPHPPYTVPAPFYGSLDRESFHRDTEPLTGPRPCWEETLRKAYGTEDFSDEAWVEIQAVYHEMCALIDNQVGRIMDYLEQSGLLENSLVVFWSDHGDFAGQRCLTEKWDTAMYDCITRVPLLMWGQGVSPATRSRALVETIDIMPTLLDLANLPPMDGVDGRSFRPVVTDGDQTHREVVLCQGGQEDALLGLAVGPREKKRPCTGYYAKQEALYQYPPSNQRTKMLRDYNWKYICYADGSEEFYDMVRDPHERHNLSEDEAHRNLIEIYRKKMLLKLIDAEPRFPYQSYLEA